MVINRMEKKEEGEEDQGDGGDPKKEQYGKKIGKGREEKKKKITKPDIRKIKEVGCE